MVVDVPPRPPAGGRLQVGVAVLHRDRLVRPAGLGPPLPIEFGQRPATPFQAARRFAAEDADVHDRPGGGLDFAELAERHLARETGKIETMRDQAGEGRLGGARQEKEQPGGDRQDSQSHQCRMQRQAGVEALQPAARRDRGLARGAANLSAGERRYGKQQVERQKQEEVDIDGQEGGSQKLHKGNGGGVKIIPIGFRREDFHHRQEKHQVDSGGEELPRKEEIIEREEAGIAEGDEGYGAIGKVQPHEPADHQAAKHQAGGGERDGRGIQIPRAGHREISAGHQAQQRELEKTLDGGAPSGPRARMRTQHGPILSAGFDYRWPSTSKPYSRSSSPGGR